MRLLITGICGFAGSTLARGLLQHLSDLHIIGLDNLIRKGSETNLEPLRSLGIDVRVGDIRNAEDVANLPASDWVIDCAANPSVLAGVDGKTSPDELLDHNLVGTIPLLEYCRKHGAGFLLLSTSRVYSIPPLASLPVKVLDEAFFPIESEIESIPGISSQGVNESFSIKSPVSLYGASKQCSEILALEYGATFGFPVRINRCGVLAGAGQFGKADQGIFSYWIHSWATNRPLRYIGFGGTGFQVRDCLHPNDIVPLLVSQMSAPEENVSRVLNVSGGRENSISLAQLSEWCSSRFGKHEVLSEPDERPFDIPWMVLDSSECSRKWNWKPKISLEMILEEIALHAERNQKWLELVI